MNLNDPFIQQLVLNYVAPVLATVIGGAVAYSVRQFYGLLKSHTTVKQLQTLTDIASIFVRAAEQTGLAGDGQAKKAWALDQIDQALAAKGLKFSAETIDATVEAAVYSETSHAFSTGTLPTLAATDAQVGDQVAQVVDTVLGRATPVDETAQIAGASS
jgi:LL-H family phage holin